MPALILGAACAAPSGPDGPPELVTTLPRSLTAPETILIAANNQFAFDLFARVRGRDPDRNLFLSPLSAGLALGMALNGAAGTTFDSMRIALRLPAANLPELNAAYRSLIDLLRGLDRSVEFRIANSIWADAGWPFRAEFLEAGRQSFDAEVRSLDLQTPASLDLINDWVKEKTGGKIPQILESIASEEVMFLINAIYFKGSWRVGFDPSDTHSAPFHAAGGETQSVPTMSLPPRTLRVGHLPEGEVLELLYGNGTFAMTIVLPAPDQSVGSLVAGLDGSRWARWLASLAEREVGLALPRFRLEYQRELKDDLSDLGMRVAFDDRRADFSRMAELGTGNLYLTRVTQKTFVNLNEEGTEAAAATSVGVGVTSAPPVLSVDRPFLFVIRERLSGTIFFLGEIDRIP